MIQGLLNLVIYLFRSDRNYLFNLIRILGFLPAHTFFYRAAFTHKSVVLHDKLGEKVDNERLEYLGDAVLGAVVAEYLFSNFPHQDEGFMTKVRARIVKRKHLNATAIKMGIPMMITHHAHPANTSKHVYGNALEALIGAIYLDRGFNKARRFIRKRMMKRHMDLIRLTRKDSDYKSQVIEWAQKHKKEITFETQEEHKKSDPLPRFLATVKWKDEQIGTGRGGSKKEAEQVAAKEALKVISN